MENRLPEQAVLESCQALELQAKEIEHPIRSFRVTDDPSYKQAGSLLVQLGQAVDKAETDRKEFKAPALKLCRMIDQKYRPGVQLLQSLIVHVRTEMENHRARVLEANRAAAASIATGTAPEQAVQAMAHVPETEGTTVRKEWTFRVVNPNMVPADYLIVDERAIGQYMRQETKAGRVPVVPGVLFEQVDKVVRKAGA